jgi:DNA anti-recombination protein RmuC
MNYSQLKRIHKLTNDHTQLQLEKAELAQKVEELEITSKVAVMQDNLNDLKATLNDKLTGLSQIVRPNVDQPLKETNTKLKEALREAVKTNAKIVQKYDELSLHYSFVPQPFREMVARMKEEKDFICLNQRHDPNNLQPT